MNIVVAMSGGVDSSVAAAILQEQGHQVQGIFMKNWSPETGQSLSDCPWMEDQRDAEAVCQKLRIPFRAINFEREYKDQVLRYTLQEYAVGRTPNPDILCNKEIKFGVLLKLAKSLGADKIATGHYARINQEGQLVRGVDQSKDQSYFLYALDQQQLSQSLFPLGEYKKSEVRQMAESYQLPTATKKDSQGICFIGNLDLKTFLREHLPEVEGRIFLGDAVIGSSLDTLFYTVGERVGRLVDNRLYHKLISEGDVPPLFVWKKDGSDLHVSPDANDPRFLATGLTLETWQGKRVQNNISGLSVQARYQQKELVPLRKIEHLENGMTQLNLGEPFIHSVASGQSAVVYSAEGVVLGGGIIKNVQTNGD